MDTYPIHTKKGDRLGFEIENIKISLKKIVKLLSSIDGVANIRRRKLFELKMEFYIEFDLYNRRYVVLEPYGDSSRYWIYPKDEKAMSENEIEGLEGVFRSYKPPIWIEIIGDILSLKFFKKKSKVL